MTVPGLARSKPSPAAEVRSVTILGATGSVGASTVDLIKRAPERYCVEAVSARRSAGALAQIAREVGARLAVVADPAAYGDLKDALAGSGIKAAAGEDGLLEAAQRPADWLMAAISGAVGLKPTLAAIERGATVALANKECLVCAGGLFMRRAAIAGATVLPVDSEHNAIFQALGAGPREDVKRIILTASGGPFRTWSLEAIQIRDFDTDRHRSVDDTPAGGGAGMVMRADVLGRAVDHASPQGDPRPRLLMSPRGKPLTQAKVRELAAGPGAVILCGRFDGVD